MAYPCGDRSVHEMCVLLHCPQTHASYSLSPLCCDCRVGGTWLLYDVSWYGVGLFGGAILNSLAHTSQDLDVTSHYQVFTTSWKQLVALGLGLPAAAHTICLLSHHSLKSVQKYGFVFIALLFAAMSVADHSIPHQGSIQLILYSILLYALNFGPAVTTYCLPSSAFPPHIRSTMGGLSAALGKIGAILGAYLFGALAESTSYSTVMIVSVGVALLGAWVTHVFVADGEVKDTPLSWDSTGSHSPSGGDSAPQGIVQRGDDVELVEVESALRTQVLVTRQDTSPAVAEGGSY
jgi:hypothetical protein